ncbi:MAG: GTP-binding protein [Myxococcota bacterium]
MDVDQEPGRHAARISDEAPPRPLHLLTGFLGSGKTTLLSRLLAGGERIGALVNDVGALGIDPLLLQQVDEDVLSLPGGCVCCSLRDDLYGAVAGLLARGAERVVLETSGIADPAPILHTFGSDPRLRALLRVRGVICVVDAVRAEVLLDEHAEAQRQLDLCDRVVVTHADRVDAAQLAAVWARVAPGREVRRAERGAVDRRWLLADAGFTGEGVRRWLVPPSSSGHAPFRTHALRHDLPVDPEVLQLWLRLVTQVDGPRLLRVKALVRDAEGGAWVLQSANRSVSPPLRVGRPPADLRGAEVVVVERGMPDGALGALLASLGDALHAAR